MNQEDKITMDKYATGEIVAVGSQAVKLVGNPQERLSQGQEAAKALMTVAKPVMIQGKPYLTIKDWQTIGSFYGLFAGAEEADSVTVEGINGFKARAVVRTSDGTIVSSAVGFCMDEGVWKGREKFAQASMAQTRACSKALRMVVGWVAHLAGYEDTPAEEMDFTDKGITKDHAEKVVKTQDAYKTAMINDINENGLKCSKCGSAMLDNRDIDGGPKLSAKGAKLRNEGKPLEGAGLKLPIYKCEDDGCKGVIWEQEELPF